MATSRTAVSQYINYSVKYNLDDGYSIKYGCLSSGMKSERFETMLEPAQIRAARSLLGWRQEDLAKASGVGTATIQRIEKSEQPVTGYVSTLVRIQTAFEEAGIVFINADEMGGFGLRLAKKKRR
jgi:DNA-binding XRE family transcriptional regulator